MTPLTQRQVCQWVLGSLEDLERGHPWIELTRILALRVWANA